MTVETKFRGHRSCSHLDRFLTTLERYLLHMGAIQRNIDIAQLIGGAPQSGGTHVDGCVYDIWQSDAKTVRATRDGGGPGFPRSRAQGFDPHLHGILNGGPDNDPAEYQLTSRTYGLFFGRNGLMSRGLDRFYKPARWRTYADGIAWMEAQMKPRFVPQVWYVIVTRLEGRTTPGGSKGLAKSGVVGYGRRLRILETQKVGKILWGRTGKDRWWKLTNSCSRKKPPARPKSAPKIVGHSKVVTWNVCSTSYRNAQWHDWRALKAARALAGMDPDVVLLQEAGSGDELATLDRVLTQVRGEEPLFDLIRVDGGEHWRHVLRDKETTRLVATKTFRLKPAVDKDGNQVVATVLLEDGARTGQATLHLDVDASTGQKVDQAESLLKQVEAWFASQGVHQLNRTYGGDTNDKTGQVAEVFRRAGYVRAAAVAEKRTNYSVTTTNGFTSSRKLASGEQQLDQLYVAVGVKVLSYLNVVDGTKDQASDHNPVTCTRAIYAVS